MLTPNASSLFYRISLEIGGGRRISSLAQFSGKGDMNASSGRNGSSGSFSHWGPNKWCVLARRVLRTRVSSIGRTFLQALPMLVLFVTLSERLACAQAPGLLWVTNVNARVFSVDSHTNVYADAGTAGWGKVIKVDAAGAVIGTNSLSSFPGMAQRDAAGNLYYAGVYPGPYSGSGDAYTNSRCFLTKFTDLGAVVWTVGFLSPGITSATIDDLQSDGEGNIYVGYAYVDHSLLAKFDSNGTNTWSIEPPKADSTYKSDHLRVRPYSSMNSFLVTTVPSGFSQNYTALSLFNVGGVSTTLTNWGTYWMVETHLIGNSRGEVYAVMDNNYLTKFNNDGTAVFGRLLDVLSQWWPIGEDPWDGVYLANNGGLLTRYDVEGNLAWSLSLPAQCNAMVSDASGNRFISMADGTIARLGAEALSAPNITNNPSGQTILIGSNTVFEVGSSGTTPLHYFWLLNGTNCGDSKAPLLTISNASPSDAGTYSVVVSNFVGSKTSTPALLRVKSVAIHNGSQLMTNGTYQVAGPTSLTVYSSFASGSVFYTLDGSTPDFSSTFYTGPFIVWNSATVRAIGYSADFLQSEEADAVTLVVAPADHTLTISGSGGGSIDLNPPGGTYANTSVVAATAVPAAGYSFLCWLGDAAGADSTVNISMERDKTISAVFGTTLSTTVANSGQVQLFPAGGTYAYGSTVRLTAIPDPGNYFGAWGNAASGNTNPLYFTILAPTQTVSSVFGATPGGQAALTILVSGHGSVTANPRANVYTLGQNISLTATPDSAESFLGWSGDASGTINPLSISMNTPKTVTANFTSRPHLRIERDGPGGLFSGGFRFTLVSDPGSVFQVYSSSNLTAWTSLGSISNSFGEIQFTDPSSLLFPRQFYKVTP